MATSSFNPAQFGATPVAPTPPGFNAAQFGATPAAAPAAPAPSANLASTIWSGITSGANAVVNTAKGGIANVESGVEGLVTPPDTNAAEVQDTAATEGAPAGALDAAAQAAEAGEGGVANVGKIVGGAAQTVLAPLLALTSAIGTPIGKALGNLVPASIAEKFSNFLDANPEVGDQANKLLNIANLAVPEAADAAAPAIDSAASTAAKAAGDAKDAIVGTPAEQAAAAQAKSDTLVKGVADDWEKPTTINSSQYNNARAALEKAPGSPQFIAEHAVNPFSNIVDDKYETESTANNFRMTAGKLSADGLRPSLQEADLSTPKTPATDIGAQAVKEVNQMHGVTPDAKEAIINTITKTKVPALERANPDGLGLTDMHDNKITYANNAGYSQFKSDADSNAALANKAMASAQQHLIEEKAPANLPVKAFNAELQKYYQAADYLDALNGKKAPVSTAQTIVRTVGKLGGAAIARHFAPGLGDIVSSFAGYRIGGALEHIAENLTNPMRDTFLKNLKVSNPPAFNQVTKFLGDEEAARATRLALPPAPEIGTKNNPRPMGSGADKSGATSVPAKKTPLPTVDPKTGRMQRTFTSTP